jgi:hypothetical protein
VRGESRARKPGQVRILADADQHTRRRLLIGDLNAPGVDLSGQPGQVTVILLSPVPRRLTGQWLIAVMPGAGERVLCHETAPSVRVSDEKLKVRHVR